MSLAEVLGSLSILTAIVHINDACIAEVRKYLVNELCSNCAAMFVRHVLVGNFFGARN